MAEVTLQQMRYFLAAVEHTSLSAAAQALHVAQPSLSEQIRRMERALGVALFVRTNRRLLLTEAGTLYAPQAHRTLAAAREASDSVTGIRELSGGTLTFGTFGSAHYILLVDAVARFRTAHPGVRLRILGLNSAEVAEAVRTGEMEAGIVMLPVDDRGLTVSRVVATHEVVYFSADSSRTNAPLTMAELARRELVLSEARWGVADPTRRQLAERAQRAGVALTPVVEVESVIAALELAARGVGDTLISLPVARELGLTERLTWISLKPALHERFAFVTPRGAGTSPAGRAMMTLMRNRLTALSRT